MDMLKMQVHTAKSALIIDINAFLLPNFNIVSLI